MFSSDFQESIIGMDHHLRHLPKNHLLFIPEVLVELEKKQRPAVEGMTLTHIAKDHHVTLSELEELLQLAEKAMMEKHSKSDLDKESIEAMQAAEESIGNVDRQKEEYERLQAKAKEESISNVDRQKEEYERLQAKAQEESIGNVDRQKEEYERLRAKAQEESIGNVDRQKEEYERLQAKAQEKSIGNVDRQKEEYERLKAKARIGREKEEYERLQAKAQEGKKIGSTGRDLPGNHTYKEVPNPQCHDMGEHHHSRGKIGDDQWQYNEPDRYQLQNAYQHHSSAHEHRDLEKRQQHGANQWQQHVDMAVSSLSPEASEGGKSAYQQKEFLVLQTKCEELKDTIREKENTFQETIRENENTIQEKKNIIREKDNIIREKENTIHKKEKIIREKENTLQSSEYRFKREKDNIIKFRDTTIQRITSQFEETIREKEMIIEAKEDVIQSSSNRELKN